MTRSVSQPGVEQIPAHIAARLAQLMRRAKGIALAKGTAYTVGTFIAAMVLAMAVDLFVPMLWPELAVLFSPPTRIAMTGAVLAATGLVAVFTLVRPMRRRYSLTAAAMAYEKDHPELQERISTTVQLLLSSDPAIFRGSRAMIEAVVAEAETDSDHVNAREVIRATRARKAWLVAGVLLAAVAATGICWPTHFRMYVQRFAAPWNDSAQFRWTSVESATGDATVPRAEPLTIEARSTGRLRAREATIYVRWLEGKGGAEQMTVRAAGTDGDGTMFRFAFPRVAGSFQYHIRVNDGMTGKHVITAVDRPGVEAVDVTVRYPEYTGVGVRHERNALGPIKALRHSRVTMRVTVNRAIETSASWLVLEPETRSETRPDREVVLTAVGPKEYEASFEVMENGYYFFDLAGGGLRNVGAAQRHQKITADADAPPEIRILTPAAGDKVALRPDDKLTIGYEASDTYGLTALRIGYSLDGEKWTQVPATMPAETAKRVRGPVVFDLAKLGEDLTTAAEVQYRLGVADNLPAAFGGPQWATSATQRIRLDPKLADYADRLAETLREKFADSVEAIIKELKAAQLDVATIQKAMVGQPVADGSQDKLAQTAGEHLSKANELALAAAGKTDFSQYEKMGGRLKEIAANHIQPAGKLTAESRELREQAEPRKDKLIQAQWHIERALEKLSAVGKEFTDLLKLEEAVTKLADMQKREENVADKLNEELRDPKDLAKLTKEQLDLLEKAKNLLKDHKQEAMEPLLDIAKDAEKTLNEKIQDVVKAQKALAEDTEAAKELQDLACRAKDLAQKQDQLAKAQADNQREAAAARNADQQAAPLKARQEALNEETAKLAADTAKAEGAMQQKQLAEVQQKQRELANKAADLADAVAKKPADEKGNPQPPEPNASATKGAAAAKDAADKLDANNLADAGEKQKAAAGDLADLAQQLAKQSGQQAGNNPDQQARKAAQAEQADKLAEQQKQLGEQVANLMKKDPQANLPLRQEAIKQDTKELGDQAKLVADFMKQLAPQVGEKAQAAAQQLAQAAPAAQAQAQQAMKNNQMAQAKAAQDQAVAAAEKADEMFKQAAADAAALAEQAAKADNSAADKQPPEKGDPNADAAAGKGDAPDPFDPLAKAEWAQAQAQQAIKDAQQAQQGKDPAAQALAQAKAAAAAEEAARQLGKASEQVAQMADAKSQQPSQQANQPSPNYQPPWFSTVGTAGKAPDMRKLNFELGVTAAEWNRLPGYLQQAIIQSSGEKVPQEYRELIKRYFQTVSQQAGGK
ncbi:MAG: hypothetical protein PHU85_09310 [Phycisphaerae bacterium]|nr:hypothetical protein [Phycisphaerae bacterium]